MADDLSSRRPLASRSSGLAQKAVALLLKTSITPNQISLISIVVSCAGAAALLYAPQRPWLYLAAALCVQLRLLCNLLDGMVAVEGGRGTPVGGLYNEVPDRIADSLFLVAWGYACGMPWLGWLAALAAACTAYIRVLGGSLGLKQDFRGPMAKQHRMALLTAACLMAFGESFWSQEKLLLTVCLGIVAILSLATCGTRSAAIARELESAAKH
ncbi:MAG: CDP-alcohol phosphatidyltransferase family protein [Beijerinckiaceae bacterium]